MNTYHPDTVVLPEQNRSMRTCPYPHENGSSSQTQLAAAPRDELAVTNCVASSCLQPVILCSACGAGNRTLAKYCRSCRQPLAFVEALAQAHAGLEILPAALTKGARQVVLSRLQGRAITALESAWGYLVFAAQGWGLGVMANTNMSPPRLLYHYELESSEEILTLDALTLAEAMPAVLAVSRNAIYALTWLPRLACQCLFRVPEGGWQIESTLGLQGRLVVRLYHPKARAYRWFVLEDLHGKVRDLPLRARGPMSAMIGVPGTEKFFFATEAEVVQFHLRDNQEHRYAAPAYGLNIKVRPQIHPRTGEVFWQGLDGLVYRCDSKSAAMLPKVFCRQRAEVRHFFCNAYDDYLYVLTPDNLLVLDYPSGAEVWSFAQEVKAKISFRNVPPRAFGNYMLCAFRSPNLSGPEERVGLFSLTKRAAPLLLHPAVAASPMPIAGVSNLIAVRKTPASDEREKSALLLFQV